MCDIELLVRDNVRRMIPYSCARNEYSGRDAIFLDANENPFGTLNRYPDPKHKELRKAVSGFRGIPVENIFTGNGSDEAIDLCFRIFCNPAKDRVMLFPPTYGMYEAAAIINDIEVVKVPLNSGFGIDLPNVLPHIDDRRIKMIFICSPNNPTGNSMDHGSVEHILQRFKGIVIIDEAYSDFSHAESFAGQIKRYKNLVVMQTFSKALGLAAARVGVVFADNKIIRYLYKVKPPYNISSLNQAEAVKRLKNTDEVMTRVKVIVNERERLAGELKDIGFVTRVYPSDANFLLVEVTDAETIFNRLLERGIVVRNRSSVVRNCLRITVGTPGENRYLINELKNITL